MTTPFSNNTDEQLLLLLRQGEEGAFTEIYGRYWEQMALYVLKVIRSEDEARDIVQEVFVSIWRRRADLVIKGPLIAYLLKSVRNLSLRFIERNLNRNQFLATLTDHLQLGNDLPAVNLIEFRQLEERVDRAIAALPPKMREIYRLSRQENLSYREIAQKLGIAETTVKKQVSNALKSIKNDVGGLSATAALYVAFLS
ncbi:RNA polymerase sigma factor [Flavitalea flava]